MGNVYPRILGRILVGNIVNIRNECLFFWVHGEWIGARNKLIVREPLRGSRDLFVPRSDSFPMNPERRHSFLNCSSTITAFNQRFKKWRHGTKWRHMWRHITQMETSEANIVQCWKPKTTFLSHRPFASQKTFEHKRLITLYSMYKQKFVLGGQWSVVTFGLKRQKISKKSPNFGIRYRFGSL